jgi:mono/diheme cytochrome c family protein
MIIDPSRLKMSPRPHTPLAMVTAGGIVTGLLLALAPQTLHTPVYASSKKAQTVGAAVFQEKGCQHCHGADLAGTDRGPDLSTIGKKWHKDRIEQQIRQGGNGMPAFGDVLQPDEIKSLIDFLSAKKKSDPKTSAPQNKQPVSPSPSVPSTDDSGD